MHRRHLDVYNSCSNGEPSSAGPPGRAFDRKRFPFKSLDVNLLRAFTSRTFTLAGAGLDATHEGGGFLFGGIAWAVDSEGAVGTSLYFQEAAIRLP